MDQRCLSNSTILWDDVGAFERCLVESENVIDEQNLFLFDIYFWVSVVAVLLIGLPVNFGIVYYEWFGGDTQKRSLVNRFTSNAIISNCIAAVSMHALIGVIR